jgi:lysyl endopeptidase
MRNLLISLLAACALPLTALATAPFADGEHAWNHADVGIGSEFRDTAYPHSLTAGRVLTPIEPQRVEAMRKKNSEPGNKVLWIGLERELPTPIDAKALAWQPTADGGHSARLSAGSPGAAALRLGLDIAELPAGAELRFAAEGTDVSVTAATGGERIAQMRRIDPIFWSPVTEGDRQVVELYLPAGADPALVRLSLRTLSHLVVSPTGSLAAAKVNESDSCHFDAKCMQNPSSGYINAKNAVARMLFQKNGQGGLCTGTLLNDTDTSTQIPYLFSAAHCFESQTVANTLTTFWFYEASSCDSRDLDGSAVRQVGGGSQLLHASAASDVLMVRLNSAPPAGAHFLGWDAAQISTGTDILVLHHPRGDVKKVSLGKMTGIGGSTLTSGSFYKAGYTHGTTEGGSSGCGLLTLADGAYRLRGGLLGGAASCANSGTIGAPGNSDDFSRLDLAFSNLSQYLQPTSTPPPSGSDFSGLWYNAAQDGWGLNVVRGTSGVYVVYIYHYDQDTTPSWLLTSGTLSGSTLSAQVFSFSGPGFGGSFNPALVAARASGTITLTFNSATTATLSFTSDGRSVSTPMTRLAF